MLLIILLLIFIVYIIEDYSIKNALNGIEYVQKPSIHVVEPEEEFEIISIIKNKTRRFVSYIKLVEKFSKGINLHIKNQDTVNLTKIYSSYFLMPKQKLERRVKASIDKRGRYFLYGATIYGGDFLGLKETDKDFNLIEEVVVLPKETNIPNIDITLSGYLGDVSVNRFILSDPILTVGFNEYTGYEPQKMISWPQSAKMNRLMVKKYDYTLETMVTVILNVDCKSDNYEELIEKCFSIVRTVCQYLECKNIKYKFITNATISGFDPIWRNMSDGWGENYLMDILEWLGRATYIHKEFFDKTLNNALNYAELGRGHIIITPHMYDEYGYYIEQLRDITGVDVCVIEAEKGGK